MPPSIPCAKARPCSADRRYQRAASAMSFSTPRPSVQARKLVLRLGEPLLGGQPEPAHGFGLVLGDAPQKALAIRETEDNLRLGVFLLGGQTSPAHGFGLVLGDTLAFEVPATEGDLRLGVALLGLAPEFREVRVLPDRPGRDRRQREQEKGKSKRCSCSGWPPFHFNPH